MALTTPPTAPNRAEPSTFSIRMDDWLAWFNLNVPEFQALALMTGSGAFTVGLEATPSITFSGDTDTGIYRPAANVFAVSTGGTEALRVNTNNSLMVGTKNTLANMTTAGFQLQAATAGKAQIAAMAAVAGANGATLSLAKSRGSALDDYTIVQTGDVMGRVDFRGADGSTTILGASIIGVVGGTPASGDTRAGISLRTGSAAATVAEALLLDTSQRVLATAPAGLGYGTGAGGAVTQLTSKATGVTLAKPTGTITTNAAALAAGASVEFTLTNSLIAATDVPMVAVASPASKYTAQVVAVAAGSCVIRLTNYTGGSLSEAVVINFALMKGVAA
jgi:hypothetical protein